MNESMMTVLIRYLFAVLLTDLLYAQARQPIESLICQNL